MLTRAYLKERRGTREWVSACVRVPEFIEVSVGACVCVCVRAQAHNGECNSVCVLS